jgi:hypothetical protein
MRAIIPNFIGEQKQGNANLPNTVIAITAVFGKPDFCSQLRVTVV